MKVYIPLIRVLFLGCVALDSGIPMILAPFFLPFWWSFYQHDGWNWAKNRPKMTWPVSLLTGIRGSKPSPAKGTNLSSRPIEWHPSCWKVGILPFLDHWMISFAEKNTHRTSETWKIQGSASFLNGCWFGDFHPISHVKNFFHHQIETSHLFPMDKKSGSRSEARPSCEPWENC